MSEGRALLRIQGYRISEELFSRGYPAGAGPCHCNARCCARGVDVDLPERDAILRQADLIKPHLDATQERDESRWFETETKLDPDFASGACASTAVIHDKCAMLDGMGRCSLQVAMLAQGRQRWALKPRYCILYPLEVIAGVIRFSPMLQDQRACCSVTTEFSQPLFEVCRDELVYLLGEAGFAELRQHYATHYPKCA